MPFRPICPSSQKFDHKILWHKILTVRSWFLHLDQKQNYDNWQISLIMLITMYSSNHDNTVNSSLKVSPAVHVRWAWVQGENKLTGMQVIIMEVYKILTKFHPVCKPFLCQVHVLRLGNRISQKPSRCTIHFEGMFSDFSDTVTYLWPFITGLLTDYFQQFNLCQCTLSSHSALNSDVHGPAISENI